MRIIAILFFLVTILGKEAISQATQKKVASSNRATPEKNETPSKNQIQSQMNEAIGELKREIAELEKQLKTETDEETIKDLKEQIAALQKQVDMMQGLNKNVSRMSDKLVQEATEDNGSATVPQKDMARITMLPKKVLTDAELLLFIKNVQVGIEKIIPPAEKTEALKIYNETKAQFKSIAIVANAATGCWMIGHWEKALFIMGKVCIDDMDDADNLNNYAAFLVMTGGEQAALPILEYLNEKYPENSTILNNIGQAWFGLGDIDKTKKYLDETKALYPTHSMANNTLANIYEVEGDNDKSISFLKASLKENYDPEKEAQLRRLGYEIKFADLPPLNYPMKNDPFGFIPLINSWDPDKIQSSIDAPEGAIALERYINGVKEFQNNLIDEDVELNKKLEEREKRMATDRSFNQELLKPYNSPAYMLAGRAFDLYCIENAAGGHCLKRSHFSSPMITGLLLPLQKPIVNNPAYDPLSQLIADCEQIWVKEVLDPLSKLDKAVTSTSNNNCKDMDAKFNAYLAKQKAIYTNGVKLIQAEFKKRSSGVSNYIKYAMYADIDEREVPSGTSIDDFVVDNMLLFGEIDRRFRRKRTRNKYYRDINSLLLKGQHFITRYKSHCDQNTSPEIKAVLTADNIWQYKVEKLECEYIKKVKTPVKYEFVLSCNTITEVLPPKYPKKKPDTQMGSANVANPGNSTNGPVQSPRGPQTSFDADEIEKANYYKAPLTSENKDISQFSLEYNKWGNLVGFNFQLSEDGATLKDPDSIESGVDSRWSWNAVASPKKGFLYKLIIK